MNDLRQANNARFLLVDWGSNPSPGAICFEELKAEQSLLFLILWVSVVLPLFGYVVRYVDG